MITIEAPLRIYADYPAKKLIPGFERGEDVAPVTYTVEPHYQDKVFIEDGAIYAVGAFRSDIDGGEDVTVRAQAGELTATFTVNVSRYDGTGWDGNSLNAETRIRRFEEKWRADGAQKGGVLFIGDSFFDADYSWLDFYTKYYPGKNAELFGIGSSTTTDWDILIERVVYPMAPKAVVINCGSNNVFDDREDALCGATSVIRLIKLIRDHTGADVYFFEIPLRVGGGKNNEIVSLVNKGVRAYSKKAEGVFCLDLSDRWFHADGSIDTSFFLNDGIHPAPASYAHYASALEAAGLVMEDADVSHRK